MDFAEKKDCCEKCSNGEPCERQTENVLQEEKNKILTIESLLEMEKQFEEKNSTDSFEKEETIPIEEREKDEIDGLIMWVPVILNAQENIKFPCFSKNLQVNEALMRNNGSIVKLKGFLRKNSSSNSMAFETLEVYELVKQPNEQTKDASN